MMEKGSSHRFGGDWTDQKLAILADYLRSYTKALKNQPFRTAYIDAFAGTGYRTPSSRLPADDQTTLFADSELTEQEPQEWLDGSARIALKTEPRFNKYIFVEKSAKRCNDLEDLRGHFPSLASDISIIRGEACGFRKF